MIKSALTLAKASLVESEAERRFWTAYALIRPSELDGLVPQHSVLALRYRLDFAIPSKKIAIEIDGYEYHSDKETFTRDRQRQRDLEMVGWRVIRFSGKEACDDPHRCVHEAARLVSVFLPTDPEWRTTGIHLPDWVYGYTGPGGAAIKDLSRLMVFETTIRPRYKNDIGLTRKEASYELRHWYSRDTTARAWGALRGFGFLDSIFDEPTPTQLRTGPHLWTGPLSAPRGVT